MTNDMVKITIPLPDDNLAGAATESVWAEPRGESTYKIKNVPFYALGISYEDIVEAEPKDGILTFKRVAQHSGHSTYRIYASKGRQQPEVLGLLEQLNKLQCTYEAANQKLVGIDVPPEANIYEVYDLLEQAENKGVIDFQEGHCGHPIQGSQ